VNQESFENRQRRGRRIFVLVAVAFLGPLFLAVALYLGGGWSPGSTIQHGILLKPPGLLPELTLPPPTGGREPASLRQVRLALGKEMARVQRVFLAGGGESDNPYFQQQHPGLIVVTAPGDNAAIAKALGERTDGDIFLADPLGNIVLRYPPAAGMPDIHKDLQHLLKASAIG